MKFASFEFKLVWCRCAVVPCSPWASPSSRSSTLDVYWSLLRTCGQLKYCRLCSLYMLLCECYMLHTHTRNRCVTVFAYNT